VLELGMIGLRAETLEVLLIWIDRAVVQWLGFKLTLGLIAFFAKADMLGVVIPEIRFFIYRLTQSLLFPPN
jgi:hypothetical protein